MSTTISPAEATANANQTLTQANFLQLLVTQMSSQDPLNPQSDTEFAAQLAQFTALQQSQNMAQNMSILQANTMMGEQVTVAPNDGSPAQTGLVSGIQLQSGAPVLMVNSQPYNLNQVTSILPPPTPVTNPTSTTTTASATKN